MRTQILILAIVMVIPCVQAQDFIKSENYALTKMDSSKLRTYYMGNESMGDYTDIFLVDNEGNKLKQIEVYFESYENDGFIEVLNESKLKNVKKIIRVIISHCACYCDTSNYYWLLTTKNKLIELPVIEEEDYEFELKNKEYIFSEKGDNIIKLIEIQDEMIKEKGNEYPVFKKISETTLKRYEWNGRKIKEIDF